MNKQHKKFDISKMTEFKPSNKSVEDQYDYKAEDVEKRLDGETKEDRMRQADIFSSID